MNGQLEVQLLGGFSVRLNDQPLRSFRSAKTRGLLAYLAAQPDREHSRDSLATLLWGELSDTSAKTNLRVELSNLKKALADHPALEISRHAVCFHRGLATVDAPIFQDGVTSFLALPVESQKDHLPRLLAAADLYGGEFLAGFHVDDAIEYEDWQLLTRERLHEQMMQALETLQLRYAEAGQWTDLAAIARRQIVIIPWTESAHRNLIQALAAQGETQAALEQYESCRQILQRELGVEPSLATQALAARLKGNAPGPFTVQHNLPSQLKSFVGRHDERSRLRELVQTERLVTLLGIGGVGKSHLAQTVAQDLLRDFGDGVWYIPLANIQAGETAHEQIALAVAAAIRYQVTDTQKPLAELIAHLADKSMLLVLDNWDHLIESAEDLLYPLLNQTPVHVLATSRTQLQLPEEVLAPLEGLPLDEAFALFVERARRVVPAFGTTEALADPGGILRICELVVGLPLGIELAASWVEHYSVAEIGRSIGEIRVEPQQAQGLVARHHALESVFEYSWRLLNPAQQQILARLSVFRGGFDRAAAATVAESSLNDLSTLISHSLVQRVAAGRYNLHPLLGEFADRKLPPDARAGLHHNYSHHFLQSLIGAPQAQWAAVLLVDFENVRSAWQYALHADNAPLIEQATVPFAEFIYQFGLMADGDALLQEAVDQFDGQPQHRELVARLLDRQWMFMRSLRGVPEELALFQRILTLSSSHDLLTQAHIQLANRYSEIGNWAQMNAHFDQAEAQAQASGDLLLYVNTVEGRIHINAISFQGDFAEGIARLQEMLALLNAQGGESAAAEEMRIRVLVSLGLVAIRYGDYALAMRCSRQNLAQAIEQQQQQSRIWFLLDLALAEQFAGLYTEAIQHNGEALALAEKIGAQGDAGLLRANLCLTLRQAGQLEQALAYGQEGIETLHQLGLARQEGQARNRVGHTLLALERWADAYWAYGEALAVWETFQHPNRYEALAGRAAAALELGKQEEALALVEEVLQFVSDQGLTGIVEPILLLLNCARVLSCLRGDERTGQILQQAEKWVEVIANRISDDRVRAAFMARPDVERLKRLLNPNR
ncbi:MAG: NACHT domain-containing protein [Caldilineaceae bacterium]|nr:NACHT domain-containing protein [Caldilineaceae bacterium]